jgi:hypothetical protein
MEFFSSELIVKSLLTSGLGVKEINMQGQRNGLSISAIVKETYDAIIESNSTYFHKDDKDEYKVIMDLFIECIKRYDKNS